MKLQPDQFDVQAISGYGPGWVGVNGEKITTSVIVASTINMLALAKIMAGRWRQEALAAQAQEVAEVGKELYKRLAVMGSHVAKLGRNLATGTDDLRTLAVTGHSRIEPPQPAR